MLNNKRYTTVNTDAGVKDGIGAIAYWIRSEDKWIKGSRPLKKPNISPNEAELVGIIIALTVVSKDPYLSTADVIVVNCDSTSAINYMEKDTYYEEYKPYVQAIYSIIPRKKVRFKWVKGHSKGQSRHWVNNWCDKEARKHYKK